MKPPRNPRYLAWILTQPCCVCASDREPLRVFGTDYPTPDGTAIRDYIHVTDLANTHVVALALNLGTGKGHSIREVIRCVESVSGRRVPYREVPRRAGDPPGVAQMCSESRRLPI